MRRSSCNTRKGICRSGVANNGILVDIQAYTSYDYGHFTDALDYPAPVLLGNSTPFNGEVMTAANFDVAVNIIASAGAEFSNAYAGALESAEGGASVDPTFAIDEPGYSAYTLEGVPAGPAATPAPEPATWAMMLMGFAGFGYAGYRKAKTRPRACCAA